MRLALAVVLIAWATTAAAQIIDQGMRPKCIHEGRHLYCIAPKSLYPIRERPPDPRVPPVRCFGQPWDPPGCRGGYG